MKKNLYCFTILVLCLTLTACSNEKNKENIGYENKSIDLDFSTFSPIIVYSQVKNMLAEREQHVGKRIKLQGAYYYRNIIDTDKYYHVIMVEDSPRCCQEDLEIIVPDDVKWDNVYPTDGSTIEIVGIFDKYENMGSFLYYISVEEIYIL